MSLQLKQRKVSVLVVFEKAILSDFLDIFALPPSFSALIFYFDLSDLTIVFPRYI